MNDSDMLTIEMSNRPPVRIVDDDWPTMAMPEGIVVPDDAFVVWDETVDEKSWVAQDGGDFCVVQEGGSSTELYLHVSCFAGDAEAFRKSCANEGAYRTSEVIEAPSVLKRLNEKERQEVFNWAERLIRASRSLDL